MLDKQWKASLEFFDGALCTEVRGKAVLIFNGTTFLRYDFGIGKPNRYEKTALHEYVEG